jgi:hypothetical protein
MPEDWKPRGSRALRVFLLVLALLVLSCLAGSGWFAWRLAEVAALNQPPTRPTMIEDLPSCVRLHSPGPDWDLHGREAMRDLQHTFVVGALRGDEMVAVSVQRAPDGISLEDSFRMIPNAGVIAEPTAHALRGADHRAIHGAIASISSPDHRIDVVMFEREGAQFRIIARARSGADGAAHLLDAVEILGGTIDGTSIPGSPHVDDERYTTLDEGLLDLDAGLLVRTDGPWVAMPCVDEDCVGVTIQGDRGSRLDVGIGMLARTEGLFDEDATGASRRLRLLGYDVPLFADGESGGAAYGAFGTRGRRVDVSATASTTGSADDELLALANSLSFAEEETLARARARRVRGHRLVPGGAIHDGVLLDVTHRIRWVIPRGTLVDTTGELLRFERLSLQLTGEVEIVDGTDVDGETDHFAAACGGVRCAYERTPSGAFVTFDPTGESIAWLATRRSGGSVLRATVWTERDEATSEMAQAVRDLVDGMSVLASDADHFVDVRFGYGYRAPGGRWRGASDPGVTGDNTSGMVIPLPNAEVRVRAFVGRPGWLGILAGVTRNDELTRGRSLWLERTEGDVEIADRRARYTEVRLFGRGRRVYELYEDGIAYVISILRNDACRWSWDELARGFRLLDLAADDPSARDGT